jgi:hypothetical protein
MRPLQDKTIDNVLRYLHAECMNGRHDGLQAVLALMRIRGVEPAFRARSKPYGSRRARRLAKLRAMRYALVATK